MLAERIFDLNDQRLFARVTGDCNPIHLDEVAARRTMAGAPIVHGIHTLLWLLEGIGSQTPDLPNMTTLRVHFGKMLYLGELAQATIVKRDNRQLRAKVSVGTADVMQLIIGTGEVRSRPVGIEEGAAVLEVVNPVLPAEVALEDMKLQRGRLAFATGVDEIAQLFPNAARLMGPRRVAALGCTTRLVGMVVPGLHSIFGGLEVSFVEDDTALDEIEYEVGAVEEELKFVRTAISGGGLLGHVEAFNRPAPVPQPRVARIRPMLSKKEFDGSVVMIVGGSRGLGELVAKVIAAGGGKVILTYVTGKSDAERVAQEITDEGEECEILSYDVSGDPEDQLRSLSTAPSHIYYFATPSIFRRRSAAYSAGLFEQFNAYYVTGFYNLVEFALRNWKPKDKISVFYPSSSALDKRPENMTEYAMSKAAGEILCADLDRHTRNLRVVTTRLGRMLTDQTASISEVESADALDTMLPLVREFQQT